MAAKLSSAPIFLMPQLINTISHHLPKTEPELATFRRTLESPCHLLEAKLRNFGFYISDNADAGRMLLYLLFCFFGNIACESTAQFSAFCEMLFLWIMHGGLIETTIMESLFTK